MMASLNPRRPAAPAALGAPATQAAILVLAALPGALTALTAVSAFIVPSVLIVSNAQAQPAAPSRIFRCGNTYTNDPTQGQGPGCRPVEGGRVTVVEGTRVQSPPAQVARLSPPAGAAGPSAAGAPTARVESREQQARDAHAREILEEELRRAQARQDELLREYNRGEPEKLGPETRNHQKYLDRIEQLKASIARNDADIQGIRRELARLGASK